MSELPASETAAPGPAAPSAGALLRAAREAAGLHIAALAVSLKVPVRKLEALEADQFDQLPDAVFIRALASSVCRALKVDPAPILERLPQTTAPRLHHEESGINAPFRAPGERSGNNWLDQLSRPVFLAVFALLLGALVLILLPTAQRGDDARPSQAVAPGTPVVTETPVNHGVPATPVPAEVATPAPAAAPTAAPVVASMVPAVAAPVVVPASAAPVAAVPVVAASVAASRPASAAQPAPANTVETAGPLSASGIVVFKTRGESWVEVTDAKGVVTLRRTLAAGETAGASGALPLAVIVGRADVTAVQVRGKTLDVVPLARDNVARFEVK